MPFYQLYGKQCGSDLEVFLKMTDEKPTDCTVCGCKNCMGRDFSGINVIEDASKPKTVSDLADKNTENLVKEGKLDKKVLEWDSRKKEKKKFMSKMNEINSITPTQKRNYIMTGRKNG